MSIDYAYYKVRKGSPMFKLIAKFYEDRKKQMDDRLTFAKSLGFSEYLATDGAIIGFEMEPEEAKSRGWIMADKKCRGFYKPRAIGKDAEIRKQMEKLPLIGARSFTHYKEYLDIGNYIMEGLTMCCISPLVLDGHYVLAMPASCVGKEFKPEDHAVRELKMSEFRALQAAEEKKSEASV